MDLEEFTNLCEKEEEFLNKKTLGFHQKRDVEFIYEIIQNTFPDLSPDQARQIYRVYQKGVIAERGFGPGMKPELSDYNC